MFKKLVASLLSGVVVFPFLVEPASAHKKYSQVQTCYKNKYVETYHPGTRQNPGYVTSSEKVVERSCPKNFHFHGAKSHKHQKGRIAHDHHVHSSPVNDAKPVVIVPGNDDDNSCLEGTLAGGVLGGALGGVLAKKDNWIWSIPTGVVGGAIVGCQIDGG